MSRICRRRRCLRVQAPGRGRHRPRGVIMKFMLLIWSNPQNWDALSATERHALGGDGVAEHAALDAALIDSGETLAHARVGPFQIQAAIAAVHAENTDWAQIL